MHRSEDNGLDQFESTDKGLKLHYVAIVYSISYISGVMQTFYFIKGLRYVRMQESARLAAAHSDLPMQLATLQIF